MGEGVQTVERSPLKISSTCDKEQIDDVALTLRMDDISSTSAGGQFLHIAPYGAHIRMPQKTIRKC